MEEIYESITAAIKSVEEKHDAAISRIRTLEESLDELRADAVNELHDLENELRELDGGDND